MKRIIPLLLVILLLFALLLSVLLSCEKKERVELTKDNIQNYLAFSVEPCDGYIKVIVRPKKSYLKFEHCSFVGRVGFSYRSTSSLFYVSEEGYSDGMFSNWSLEEATLSEYEEQIANIVFEDLTGYVVYKVKDNWTIVE